jgi:hypothetical protein
MDIKKTKTVLLGIITLLSFLVFIQACEKSTAVTENTITLQEDQPKSAVIKGKNISITATNFTDSRCPINADCVWQGYAMVKINFKDDTKEQNINMCIGGCEIVSVNLPNTIVLNDKTYDIKLSDVTPYPTTDKVTPEPSKAKIVITER